MSKIKQLREDRGLTKAALAKAVQVEWGTVHSWEKGKHKPTLYNLAKLAEVFGCRLEDLVNVPLWPLEERKQ